MTETRLSQNALFFFFSPAWDALNASLLFRWRQQWWKRDCVIRSADATFFHCEPLTAERARTEREHEPLCRFQPQHARPDCIRRQQTQGSAVPETRAVGSHGIRGVSHLKRIQALRMMSLVSAVTFCSSKRAPSCCRTSFIIFIRASRFAYWAKDSIKRCLIDFLFLTLAGPSRLSFVLLLLLLLHQQSFGPNKKINI